ncbi:PilN domain-containing protein [Montanilutibacter psychrotolerans]|uniref:General secretion pathway protein GspL n=1 Tax=Montanilutibacter psychrotolerans TaxID=1327343 RepID=A0A3M8SZJ4_9GAMM|nr:PilN domain-containing protein [Lysobacter psychrotolerans]RNF84320.1 general secretion pathway protein GspL [Lysobacter psychrotolerans]
MNSVQDRLSQDGLRRLGARLAPGTGGFFSWWGRSLASWLSPRQRRVLGLDRGRLLLHVDGDTLSLRLQRGDAIEDVAVLPAPQTVDHVAAGALGEPVLTTPDLAGAALTPDGDLLARVLSPAAAALPRWLLLPAASGLRRRMPLPAAAAERLRDVVGFEIDRQTPFTVDAVAFDARVLGRREGDGQLDVELVAVPRRALDAQLAALGPLATTLAGVDLAATDGAPLRVNLLPLAQRRHHADPWRGWNLALAAVALVAVAATLWQLLENRRAAATAFEQRIAKQAEPARRAATQRQELISLIEGQAFLDKARAGRPSAVEVVDELARRLPDGTYLEKLSIEDNRLMLIGLSNEAAALIGRLQGSKLWRSPAFGGALQPDPGSGRDRFTLTAELAIATTAPVQPKAANGNAPVR